MLRKRVMWILLTFDLPVVSPRQRKAATKYRKFLLGQGFEMAQLSVYLRYCASKSVAQKYIKRAVELIPEEGRVDILQFSDKQYENLITYDGKSRQIRKNPDQYVLF